MASNSIVGKRVGYFRPCYGYGFPGLPLMTSLKGSKKQGGKFKIGKWASKIGNLVSNGMVNGRSPGYGYFCTYGFHPNRPPLIRSGKVVANLKLPI